MDILLQIESLGKQQRICCPGGLNCCFWNHGCYKRYGGFSPFRRGSKIIFVSRWKCRNRDCPFFNRTFSAPPFPTFRYIGPTIIFLLQLLFLSRPELQTLLRTSLSQIHRLKKRGKALQSWLQSSNLLSEPYLNWMSFIHLYSRVFYPRRYPSG